MTTYRHPKLERTAKNYGTTFILEDNKGEIMRKNMYEKELLALGFEEVSDEVGNVEKDWIDVVGDNFLGELFATKDIKFKELTKYCLREQIEKHMPPQKKFTGNDVHEHSMKTYGGGGGCYVNFTLNFLRDHDLLEE